MPRHLTHLTSKSDTHLLAGDMMACAAQHSRHTVCMPAMQLPGQPAQLPGQPDAVYSPHARDQMAQPFFEDAAADLADYAAVLAHRKSLVSYCHVHASTALSPVPVRTCTPLMPSAPC